MRTNSVLQRSASMAHATTNEVQLAIIYREVEKLKPDPKNPRAHSRKQIKQIANSIKSFGFNVPILVDLQDFVVAGHGRLLASRELGISQVPTIRLDHLTPAQAKAFLIADNRLTDTSTWDDKLLAEQLKELSLLDLDFDLEAIGFDMGEIDFRIESLEQNAREDDPADHIPSSTDPTVTRPGDLWQLGQHRIYCGSALDQTAYETLLHGKVADLVFTDPPYNVRIDGHVSGNGAVSHREFAMASGEMTEHQFVDFLGKTCGLLTAHSAAGSVHYVCMDWRHLGELLAAGKEAYSDLLNVCVWVKHNAGMGSFYRSQHELVFVFKKGGAPHRNNIDLGKHGRHRTNVWSYSAANNFGRATEEGNLLAMHPTVKPVILVADAILDASRRGDLVVDAFLGSGTTLIACERVGRICHALELDPAYVDTAIRRWKKFTGEEAISALDGTTFTQREKEAANG